MNRFVGILCLCLCAAGSLAALPTGQAGVPRLVVIVVGDQVRADYPERFASRLAPDGLRRFTEQGTYFPKARIDQAVTVTAPGHVLIGSGLYARQSGIVANRWYDESLHRLVLAEEVSPTGEASSTGRVRLQWFQGKSLAERIHRVLPKSRFISVSWKERSALLLGGPDQDEAYWWDDKAERFVCYGSTASWQAEINQRAAKDLKALGGDYYSDELIGRLAARALDAWQLGAVPGRTDILTVSFSAVDLVGHRWGPDAEETAEAFARLDRAVAELLRHVERHVQGEVVWVFTSDHGVTPIPRIRKRKEETSGRVDFRRKKLPHPEWIAEAVPPFITLDEAALARAGVTLPEAEEKIKAALVAEEGVQAVYREADLLKEQAPADIQRAYWKPRTGQGRRCGHLWVVLKPGYIFSNYWGGTTHGQPHPDDQNVPLAFYGAGIPARIRSEPVSPAVVAPTILKRLRIPTAELASPVEFF